MEGHSLAVRHMQRLSKTRGWPQSLRDTGQEVGKVLARSSANASLGPKEASFPVFVPLKVALAERLSTIRGSRAGCRQVYLQLLSTLRVVYLKLADYVAYEIAITLILPSSAFGNAINIISKLL